MIGQAPAKHVWKFVRAGGFDQVRLDSGADLMALDQLDQKLWAALSCPTRGLEFDTRTLDLIDTDKDGRIRVPEVVAAAKWAGSVLKDPDILTRPATALPLNAINDAVPEGKQLLASARQILENLGKKDAAGITVEDTIDTVRIFAQTRFNGDGIIPVDAAEDDVTQSVIQDIIACLGAETDRSGKPGINQAKVDKFFADAMAYSDWHRQAEKDPAILALGDATPAAAAALRAVRAKMEDYLARCRLAAFDPRALSAVNREEEEYLSLAAKDLTITSAEIAALPLSRIDANRPLPLREGLNPAWAQTMATFETQVVKPILGEKATLTEADWFAITGKFAAFEAWNARTPSTVLGRLPIERIRQIVDGNSKDTITKLIARDKALEPEANSIAAVERLVRYYRDLFKLLNNFVSFRDFYGRKEKAVFQAGTLYLDQRACDLCLRVDDMGKHSSLAGLSRTYIAYCDVTRKSSNEKMTVAAAVSAGDSDNLMVGRNGIFYDRQGRDWDATITKIVENPISIQQAVSSPYKKFLRLVESQIEKFASAKEKGVQDTAATKVGDASKAIETGPAQMRKEAFDIARFAGIFAAIGLAIGAIGGALGAMVAAFSRLAWWQMPLAILGIMILISGPSVIIAWLKLRQRNLGPLLDANGWAVNAKARINIPFGRSLTSIARLPLGAQRDLIDPYAESKKGRNITIAIILILILLWGLWYFGAVEMLIPDKLPKSGWMQLREEKARELELGERTRRSTRPSTETSVPASPSSPGN